MLMNNFILDEKNPGVLTYDMQLRTEESVELAVEDFSAMLDELPEPVFKWLDERGDDCLNGPGAWSCEIQNDQEAHFLFGTFDLECELLIMLVEQLTETVFDHRLSNLDPSQDFQLGFKLYVEYCTNSTVQLNKLTIAVFWELAE